MAARLKESAPVATEPPPAVLIRGHVEDWVEPSDAARAVAVLATLPRSGAGAPLLPGEDAGAYALRVLASGRLIAARQEWSQAHPGAVAEHLGVLVSRGWLMGDGATWRDRAGFLATVSV